MYTISSGNDSVGISKEHDQYYQQPTTDKGPHGRAIEQQINLSGRLNDHV